MTAHGCNHKGENNPLKGSGRKAISLGRVLKNGR